MIIPIGHKHLRQILSDFFTNNLVIINKDTSTC